MKFILSTWVTKSQFHENVVEMKRKKWLINGFVFYEDELPEGMTTEMIMNREKRLSDNLESQKIPVDFIIEDGDPSLNGMRGLHL